MKDTKQREPWQTGSGSTASHPRPEGAFWEQNEQTRQSGQGDGNGNAGNRRNDEPDRPTDLSKESWGAVLKRTLREFKEDDLTDWAAALTYYAILSLFPGLLVLVSILGLIGASAIQPLIDNLGTVAPGPAKEIVTSVLTGLQSSGAAGIGAIIGVAVAL